MLDDNASQNKTQDSDFSRNEQDANSFSVKKGISLKNVEPFNVINCRDEKIDFNKVYLIQDLLAMKGVSSIYGASGQGKTFFALDLAYSVARGVSWCGKEVHQGACLYIALEGIDGFKGRLKAHLKGQKLEEGKEPIPLFRLDAHKVNICKNESDTDKILKTIETIETVKQKVRLVIIDTLACAMSGEDENSSMAMTKMIVNCRKISEQGGVHVILVHHSGKNSAMGMRGHSSLNANVDTEIKVSQDYNGIIEAVITKRRDGEKGDKFYFEIKPIEIGKDNKRQAVNSAFIEQVDLKSIPKKCDGLLNGELLARDTLNEAMESEGIFDEEREGKVVKKAIWQKYFLKKTSCTEETGKRNFRKAKAGLITKGLCKEDKEDELVWIVEQTI